MGNLSPTFVYSLYRVIPITSLLRLKKISSMDKMKIIERLLQYAQHPIYCNSIGPDGSRINGICSCGLRELQRETGELLGKITCPQCGTSRVIDIKNKNGQHEYYKCLECRPIKVF